MKRTPLALLCIFASCRSAEEDTGLPIPFEPEFPTLVFNEFSADNDFTDLGDWLELYNASDAPIAVAGWTLVDRTLGEDLFYTLDADITLNPGAHLFVSTGQYSEDPFYPTLPFRLDDGGDCLTLLDPDGEQANIVCWGPAEARTYSRIPDGGQWTRGTPPTPGEPNQPPL